LNAQRVLYQGAAGIEVDLAAVAEVTIFIKGILDTDRANPLAIYSAGNNVDYAAHGI